LERSRETGWGRKGEAALDYKNGKDFSLIILEHAREIAKTHPTKRGYGEETEGPSVLKVKTLIKAASEGLQSRSGGGASRPVRGGIEEKEV